MLLQGGPCYRRRRTALMAALSLLASVVSAEEAKNYALLIGISHYSLPSVRSGLTRLDFADDDAKAIATLLDGRGSK